MTTTEQEIEEIMVKIKEVEEDLAGAKKDGKEKLILMYGNNLAELRRQYNNLWGLLNKPRSTTGK